MGVLAVQGDTDVAEAETASTWSPQMGLEVAQAAKAAVGAPFAYGGTGPYGYDNPGLTMHVWAEVGVSLMHSTRAQLAACTVISQSDMLPGDLVFFYSTQSTVAVYVGDGNVVLADEAVSKVRNIGMARMPDATVVRLG